MGRDAYWLRGGVVVIIGALASTVIAFTGLAAETDDPAHDLVSMYNVSLHLDGPRVAYLAGALVLTVCWLSLGRGVRETTVSARSMRLVAAVWSLPQLLVPPVASRDVWAYAGQAAAWVHGVDPYRHGSIGRYSAYVGQQWQHTASPYGPIWVLLAAMVVVVAGSHVMAAVVLLRFLCVLGVVLVAAALPRLTRTLGGNDAVAVWALCASPLTIAVIVGGAHNDALLGGLIAVAFWCAFGDGRRSTTLWPAAALLTIAAEVKLPAAICLAFLPLVWLACSPAARGSTVDALSVIRAGAEVIGVAAVIAVPTSVIPRLGIGWLDQLNSAESGIVWISLPVLIGFLWTALAHNPVQLHVVVNRVPDVVGAVAAGGVVALLAGWFAAIRRHPAHYAAAAVAGSVLLSLTVQPWYAIWAFLLAASLLLSPLVIRAATVMLVAVTLSMHPDGSSWLAKPPLVAAIAVALLVVYLTWRPSPAHPLSTAAAVDPPTRDRQF